MRRSHQCHLHQALNPSRHSPLVSCSKLLKLCPRQALFNVLGTRSIRGDERQGDASCTPESSILAFSAASVKRCSACLSFRRSMPSVFWKSSASQSTITLSKSSPPKWVSPLVASTSQTPSPTSRTDTSKVPPPKSNTKMVSLFFFSRPYAKDAAVGSFTMRSTSSPAILPASFVA
eukprot:Skav229189  [mRNA]  locus=scaffold1004:374078:375486:+ [translate_table: standard]